MTIGAAVSVTAGRRDRRASAGSAASRTRRSRPRRPRCPRAAERQAIAAHGAGGVAWPTPLSPARANHDAAARVGGQRGEGRHVRRDRRRRVGVTRSRRSQPKSVIHIAPSRRAHHLVQLALPARSREALGDGAGVKGRPPGRRCAPSGRRGRRPQGPVGPDRERPDEPSRDRARVTRRSASTRTSSLLARPEPRLAVQAEGAAEQHAAATSGSARRASRDRSGRVLAPARSVNHAPPSGAATSSLIVEPSGRRARSWAWAVGAGDEQRDRGDQAGTHRIHANP